MTKRRRDKKKSTFFGLDNKKVHEGVGILPGVIDGRCPADCPYVISNICRIYSHPSRKWDKYGRCYIYDTKEYKK